MMSFYALSPHEYYRGLNRRCDNRTRLMLRMGYKMDTHARVFWKQRFPYRYTVPFASAWHTPKRALFEVVLPGIKEKWEEARA